MSSKNWLILLVIGCSCAAPSASGPNVATAPERTEPLETSPDASAWTSSATPEEELSAIGDAVPERLADGAGAPAVSADDHAGAESSPEYAPDMSRFGYPMKGFYCYLIKDRAGQLPVVETACFKTQNLCGSSRKLSERPGLEVGPCEYQDTAYCFRLSDDINDSQQNMCSGTPEDCELNHDRMKEQWYQYTILKDCARLD